MKYRIKEIVLDNDSCPRYYPQYKKFLIWRYFKDGKARVFYWSKEKCLNAILGLSWMSVQSFPSKEHIVFMKTIPLNKNIDKRRKKEFEEAKRKWDLNNCQYANRSKSKGNKSSC